MQTSILNNVRLGLAVLIVTLAAPDAEAQVPERCSVGEALSAFHAFYPAIFSVNEFSFDQNGQVVWITTRGGGLGQGVANCQFRLYAASPVASGPALPDQYSYCSNDVFFGANAISFPYKIPEAQAFLDFFYPDVKGSYREKAKAELDLVVETVELTRETYYDASGAERPVGDGGTNDPAISDPTAGDPKPQEMVVTDYRDSFNGNGDQIVYRHDGFFGQLEPGRYQVATKQFFDGFLFYEFAPVELNIVPCD